LHRPVSHRDFVGEIQRMPADLLMVQRGRVAIARRDNLLDPGSFSKCFYKSTADATGPACNYDIHQFLPATHPREWRC
jgi:hypothetical protein